MANVMIATNSKAMLRLDGSIKSKVQTFLEKVYTDHTAPGLHIEPLRVTADPRVRTGRVDQQYRAILFQIDPPDGGEPTFVYMGTWNHDDAIKLAEKSVLRVNPVNWVVEAIMGELDGLDDRRKRVVVPDHRGDLADELTRRSTHLTRLGFALTDLTDRLGIETTLAERVMAADTEDEILALAATGVAWQQTALLELMVGTHIDEIRDKLGFTVEADGTELTEDERILAGLERPASKMQFTFIEDNEELRRVIEGGDFAAWRTFLHPEQRRYAERDQSGSFRLSGGAGTGKTVVAIHRARHLAKRDPAARLVLTTFNKTLAQSLADDLRALDPTVRIAGSPGEAGICVRGIDAVARAIVDRAGSDLRAACAAVLGTEFDVTGARTRSDIVWRSVTESEPTALEARLKSPVFLESEYVSVVLGNTVTGLDEYLKVPRPGRGVRLSKAARTDVWKLVEAYRRQSRADGTVSFPEMLALAAEYLRIRAAAGKPHLVDHVIVDEAQDLHATHWALLRAMVAEQRNDLFVAEDSHQRIYGQPIVLSRLGIRIQGRSRRLTLNYRTTAQNLAFAVGVLTGADYKDLEQNAESASEYRSARTGPHPQLVECDSAAAELSTITEQVREWKASGADPGTIAVLVRGHDARERIVRALRDHGIGAGVLDSDPVAPDQVRVLTMHRAKGMEFARVILAGVNDGQVPLPASVHSVPAEERAEALLRERSLLYVAASRARDELVVTWSGRRSELLGQ